MADAGNVGSLKPIVLSDPSAQGFDRAFDKVLVSFDKRFEGFEERSDLVEYMQRNADPAVQQQGPSREMWVALQNEGGDVVAFANRQVNIIETKDGPVITTQDAYIYVDGKGPNAEREKAIAGQLYAAADAATLEFAQQHLGDKAKTTPVYGFAAETSPLLVPKTSTREPEIKYTRDLDRLSDAGFQRVGARYLEPSYDEKNGDPTRYYDQFVKLPEGVSALPADVYKAHLERTFSISYPEGTSLDNQALAPMKASIDKCGAQIPVIGTDNYPQLMADIKGNLPDKVGEQKGQPTAELNSALGRLAGEHYKDRLPDYQDVIPKTVQLAQLAQQAQQAGTPKGNGGAGNVPDVRGRGSDEPTRS